MGDLLNGFAIKHESADMDSNGEYRTMFFAGAVARNKNAWTNETPSNIKRFDTAEQAQKTMRRTAQWWLCSVVTYKEAVEHAAANSEHSDKDLALKITEILKENLDDYEDMERPDYDAMLYALRDIKELINNEVLK